MQPHLTVTSGPPSELAELAARVAEDLTPTSCTVDVLTALEQQLDGRWRTVGSLTLRE